MMFERNKMGINSSSYPIWKIEGIRRQEWIIFEYDFALKWTMSGQFVVFKRSPPFMDPHIWPSEPSSSWAIVSISYAPPPSSKSRSNYIGLVTWIIFLHSNLSSTKFFNRLYFFRSILTIFIHVLIYLTKSDKQSMVEVKHKWMKEAHQGNRAKEEFSGTISILWGPFGLVLYMIDQSSSIPC